MGNPIINFMSNPIMRVAEVLLTLISIILAIFFFNASRIKPKFNVYVHPIKTVIVKSNHSSRLSIQYDNFKIKGDVSAVQIAIWNCGKKSIRPENVLEPIIFSTENRKVILEAKVINSTRDVIKLKIDDSNFYLGDVGLTWNILEQNDGGIIQIVYAGNVNEKIDYKGTIEGQSKITNINKPSKSNLYAILLFGAINLLLYAGVIIWRIRCIYKFRQRKSSLILSYILIIGAMTCIVIICHSLIRGSAIFQKIPFTFYMSSTF